MPGHFSMSGSSWPSTWKAPFADWPTVDTPVFRFVHTCVGLKVWLSTCAARCVCQLSIWRRRFWDLSPGPQWREEACTYFQGREEACTYRAHKVAKGLRL
jgi:hypothetical protein